MRRVKFIPRNQGTHNGWQDFLRSLKVGDEFEVPGTAGKKTPYLDSRSSNIRFMGAKAGVVIRTRRTPTGLYARRVL